MKSFTEKTDGIISHYELDEENKILYCTVRFGRRDIRQTQIKLCNLDAEFSEAAFLRDLPGWSFSLALIMTFIVIPLIFLLLWSFINNTDLSYKEVWLSISGIGFWLLSLWLFFHKWCSNRDGCFVFKSKFHYDLEINYLRNKRLKALEFAETISRFCNQQTLQTEPIAEHQFKNGLVKLFEDRGVLYNQFGVKHYAFYYADVSSKIRYQVNQFIIGNIIFGTLAGIFFTVALFMFGFGIGWIIYRIIGGAVDGVDILTLISFCVIGILPLALGKFFFGWCHPTEKYYTVLENNDEGIGARFEIGKDTVDEHEFISILKKLLRDARKDKSKCCSDNHKHQDVQTVSILEPEYVPTSNITVAIRIIASLLNVVSGFALFSLWKKPGGLIMVGAATVMIWLIAEHVNNYFVRRKK